MSSFNDRLRSVQESRSSVLCVGLDPDPARIPEHLLEMYSLPDAVATFNRAIIEATSTHACAFKLNLAFYEIMGRDGWDVLEDSLQHIPTGVITIADAKRADIGNSARFYAEAIFDQFRFDACTVAPYMGRDSVVPFLEHPGRAAFVLARTSNPGAADFQHTDCSGEPLYLRVARYVAQWSEESTGEAGLVAGATDASALSELRAACPTLPFLIPGVGAQGGEAAAVIEAAETEDGLVLVNSSRQILYASDGPDFAEAAAREASAMQETLEAARRSRG